MAKKTRAQVTAEYEARVADQGGGRFPTITLSPDEMALWEEALAQDKGPDRGKAKRTLLRALATMVAQKEPNWPAELRRLADYLEREMR